MRKGQQKETPKKVLKNLKKGVDKSKSMIYNSSCAVEITAERNRSQTSKKRVGPWKLNNEKIKKPVMTLREAQRITVRCNTKNTSGNSRIRQVYGMSD